MKHHDVKRRARSAYSLVETAFAVALLGLVLGSIAFLSSAQEGAFETGTLRNHVEAQAATALERMIVDLRIASLDSIDLADGGAADGLEYQQAVGVDGTAVQMGPTRRLAFEYEIGEVDDGVDNNGNGLVDEGRVVLTESVGQPDERQRVITRWVSELGAGEEPNLLDDDGDGLVDEPGFLLQRQDGTILLRMTLERPTSGGVIRRTVQSSVRLRN